MNHLSSLPILFFSFLIGFTLFQKPTWLFIFLDLWMNFFMGPLSKNKNASKETKNEFLHEHEGQIESVSRMGIAIMFICVMGLCIFGATSR